MREKPKDLTGIAFGNLIIEASAERRNGYSYWKCRCSCGRITTVREDHLRRGETKNCRLCGSGWHRKDLCGQRFGRLIVLSFHGVGNRGSYEWNVRCDCGTEKVLRGGQLRNGVIVSCGCFQKEKNIKRLTTHGKSKTKIYRAWMTRKRIETEVLLDSSWRHDKEFLLRGLFPFCVICGSEENLEIDHLLPISLGYGLSEDNAVVLCGFCNSSKGGKYISDLPKEIRRKIIDASCEFQDYCDV